MIHSKGNLVLIYKTHSHHRVARAFFIRDAAKKTVSQAYNFIISDFIKSTLTYVGGHKKCKCPLHTLLAASAEVLPLKLSMLVIMVMVMMMMLKVRVVSAGGSGARWAAGASMDDAFGRAFVDHMWVVTSWGAVVVLLSEMLGQRRDQILLLLRHTDQTWLEDKNTQKA